MWLEESNKMLKKIHLQDSNCEKKRIGETGETSKGKSKEPLTSLDTTSIKTKVIH